MPIVIDTAALLRPPIAATAFTTTKWYSATDKAAFANALCRFIAADFKDSLFTKKLCQRLSLTFGHIAHGDLLGFYDTFFRDLRGKIAFLEETLAWPCYGDPAYTFCDVEHAVQQRLNACNLLGAYRQLRAAEIEGAERALLALLRRKYEGTDAPPPMRAPVLHAGPPPKAGRTRSTTDQASLF